MAKINGTRLKIYVGGSVIDNLSKVQFSNGRAMIDVTTKDSASWKEVLPGLKDAKFSGDGLVDFASSNYKPSSIWTDLTAGNSVAVLLYDAVSGDKQYSSSGYFSKIDIDGGTEDAVKFSFEITVTGAVTQSAIT